MVAENKRMARGSALCACTSNSTVSSFSPTFTVSSPFRSVICSVYLDLLKLLRALYLGHPIPRLGSPLPPAIADSIFPLLSAGDRPSSSHPQTHSAKAYQTFGAVHGMFYVLDAFLHL